MRSEPQMIEMRDGTLLHAIVHRAEGRAPAPVVLLRSPYDARSDDGIVKPFVHPGGAEGLVAEGWAVVHQDVRGRYGSQGVNLPFVHDVDDAYDTLSWIAGQPWSNGRVVMAAPSGLGATQHLAALSGHPALVAIAPLLGVADPRSGWVTEGGALQLRFALQWAAQQGIVDAHLSAESLSRNASIHATAHERAWDLLSASDLRGHSHFFDAWVRDDEDFWKPITRANEAPPPPPAAFHVVGWYDIFAEGSLAAFRRMAAAATPDAPQRLLVGPWSHTTLWTRHVGDIDFGPEADGTDGRFRAEVLRWLRAVADQAPASSAMTVFVMGHDRWVDLPAWPPRSVPLTLHLTSSGGACSSLADGRLVPSAHISAALDEIAYDPADPVPTCGGRALFVADGPREQSAREARPDVATYTSAPLDDELVVVGEVVADLTVRTDAPSIDVCATLVDVHPDGTAYNVVDSVQRTALEPGTEMPVSVRLGSTAIAFLPGHRIRLQVSASNFPRLDRNPATGEHASVASELRPATLAVLHGYECSSTLTLPTARL